VFHGFSTALAEELAAPNVLSCQATEWKEIYDEEKWESRGFFFDITQKKTRLLIKPLTVPRINKDLSPFRV
jgi:crotonobetainyl-CoA:carnitine CoA-transferase CaiB-like acyl-CoA transferase